MGGATLIAASASGAVLGSAAGVALARWPGGGSILTPVRSSCAACGSVVGLRDLVPVASWLILRGRCRACDCRIDVRLPLLELTSALATVGVVHIHGVGPGSWLLVLGAVGSLLATFTDLERRTIPDRLTVPLAGAAVVGMMLLADTPQERSVVILWALGIPLILEVLARTPLLFGQQRAMGGGDVKLLIGLLALATAFPGGPLRLLSLSFIIGGLHAALGLVLGSVERGDRLPFAPAIAMAFLAVVLLPAT